MPVLEINNLSKSYGSIKALNGFSLKVEQGDICGILGPNGSGKTTTLGIILDVLKPDAGDFLWFGRKPGYRERKKVGALLEVPLFYPYLSAVRNLQIIADIKGIPYSDINGVLESVGLGSRKSGKFKTYSTGMRQRLAIAAAMMGEPDVLILDEPTNGLDPQGIAEIRNLIIKIGKQGTTILLASHLLDEVQKVCTHVVVLEKGKKLSEGNVKEALSSSLAYELAASDMRLLRNVLEQTGYFSEISGEKEMLLATAEKDIAADELNKMLVKKGVYVTHLARRKKSLEKYFLDLLNEKNA